jgi:hypothetical protein
VSLRWLDLCILIYEYPPPIGHHQCLEIAMVAGRGIFMLSLGRLGLGRLGLGRLGLGRLGLCRLGVGRLAR